MRGERDPEVEAIAATIRNATGNAVAAITIGLPVARMNEARREELATLVRMGANLASFQLGYRDEVNTVRDVKRHNLGGIRNN